MMPNIAIGSDARMVADARPSDASLRAQVLDRSEHLALVFNHKPGRYTAA